MWTRKEDGIHFYGFIFKVSFIQERVNHGRSDCWEARLGVFDKKEALRPNLIFKSHGTVRYDVYVFCSMESKSSVLDTEVGGEESKEKSERITSKMLTIRHVVMHQAEGT